MEVIFISGKVNHRSLAYKMQTNPNKKYKDLKQKQKARISDWMFREVCEFYKIHNRMPLGDELNVLAETVYTKIKGAAIWVPYNEFLAVFQKKLNSFHERIQTAGLPEIREKKPNQPAAKKSGKKKKSKNKQENNWNDFQDDRFFFIAGYTSGGAPYGITWEEMGMNPYDDLD